MVRNISLGVVLCLVMTLVAAANSQRTILSVENSFPELHQLELGLDARYTEDTIYNGTEVGPYARFGLFPKLTASVFVPYVYLTSDYAGDEAGLGDVEVGVDLAAYDDDHGDLGFIIPYIRALIPTGDEDKGLGEGDLIFTYGTSIGATVCEWYTLLLDGTYMFRPDRDNVMGLAFAFIWDTSEKFAVTFEAKVTDEKNYWDEYPLYLTLGMSYKPTENLMIRWGGGSSANEATTDEVIASVKAAYSF